ncbi:uncharacterized protein PGTG_16317 [Puccinia graminis f. sp. tritici CRL 75-36-700-3]|uniref:Uncharacterized protein n=1 Tax=Puccinia graminis f. sp. tritici (strain CRL 75-36-700-3 / race SCCL) TaxID=418459 RepID=E3L196_PUCGT|nr:uncharacterized protein PGTG_16317 [Puccinia graminis f. sp. tritici CRL 75-36-700-3]EFP90291.1 hypothetical protein PGTG_16317 [Puccinia graminis f. sp. tritici CRL 75-36-700-3]
MRYSINKAVHVPAKPLLMQLKINTPQVFKLLDLASTQEDHTKPQANIGEIDVDIQSMLAGTQRSSLPLMRRFNEHSQRLLDSSLYLISQGQWPKTKNWTRIIMSKVLGGTMTLRMI